MLRDSVTYLLYTVIIIRWSTEKRKEMNENKNSIIKCKAKLYKTYELLSKRILHKLYIHISYTHTHIPESYQRVKVN